MKPHHFFASRRTGVNYSEQDSAWRFGSGNVFRPSAEDPESRNALENQVAILQQQGFPSTAVMTRSQYKKGIEIIDADYLVRNSAQRNEKGILVVDADGLFTTLPDVSLLNVSGDAHSIIFESPRAVAILVGSWRCIEKEIFDYMMSYFLAEKIDPSEIVLRIGPGLGANAYSIGADIYEKFTSLYGKEAECAFQLKTDEMGNAKVSKRNGAIKYVVNFPELMRVIAQHYEIGQVIVEESQNTFDKQEWKPVKLRAKQLIAEDKKVAAEGLLKEYYGNQSFFSARQYSRIERLMQEGKEIPGNPYSRTGRCLNGVALTEGSVIPGMKR